LILSQGYSFIIIRFASFIVELILKFSFLNGGYIVLRGRWCNIIVLNVHAPCEDEGNDVKDSFYEELGRVSDQFPMYDMKILLGDFNAKVGRENIFKPTFGIQSLHEISSGNRVRIVNFATSKNLVIKSTMFPRRRIHKYTWTSSEGNTQPK
jgi:hypothetical protein